MSKDQVIEGFRSIADDFDKIVDVDTAALVLMDRVDALSARAAEALILADKLGCFDGIETWDRVRVTALPVFNAAAPKVISGRPKASRLGDLLDDETCRRAMDVSGYGLSLVMRAAEMFAASEPGRIALPKDQQINVDPHRGWFRTIFCLSGITGPVTYSWNEHVLLEHHHDWLSLHPDEDCQLASFCELKKQQVGICASLFRVLADLLDEADPGDKWPAPTDRAGGDEPFDKTAYIPAKDCLCEYAADYNKLRSILKQNDWIRTYSPSRNRLLVHAGDWNLWKRQKDSGAFQAIDSTPEVVDAFLEEAGRRKERIRRGKAGK